MTSSLSHQQAFTFRHAETPHAVAVDFFRVLSDGAWHKGRDLCRQLDTDERTLRQCASDARGSVISGQRGYRLTSAASTEEIDRAEHWLRHQGKEMIRRSMLIRRARNQGGRAA